MRTIRLALAVAVSLGGASLAARADTFPTKQLRFVVPFTPGGAVDLVARVIGDKMSRTWNQTVVVENRPGAGSTIGTDAVAKAEPDGHTFLLAVTAHAINATLYKKLPYDPIADFAPVSLVATAPNVLVAHPDVPAKTVGELITYAKANPGKLNFASPGAGTSQHLAGELFHSMAGIEVVHVPYKGTMPALTDLMRGDASYTFDPAVAMQYVREGKLKALGVTSAQRSPRLPEIPTIAETALPGYEAIAWYGVFAPAKTPPSAVAALNAEIVRIMKLDDVQERVRQIGLDPTSSTPDAFAAYLATEIKKWGELVRASGAQAD